MKSNELLLQVKKMEEQYIVENKEKEIAILKKDQQLSHQQLKQQQFILIASLVFGVLAFLAIWLLINRYQLRQRMKELELRNRIAADLHDEVGSSLSSINMLSQMAKIKKFNQQEDILNKVSTNARETMEKMSDIVWMIKPSENEGYGLKERMQRFITDLCSSQDIECNFRADDLDGAKLTMTQKKNLYLIFKEAINNAVKYSGTKVLDVDVQLHQKSLAMHIQDYGNGFDERIVVKGNGLDNMQVRAKELQGNLQISSGLHQGTKLDLTFPVK
jgi:signal transduction histidine kinase